MNRAIGGYERVKWWSESERPPLVCAQYSQEHRADGDDVAVREGRRFEVRLVGERPHASHRYRRRSNASLADPTALLAALLSPADARADRRETERAAPRLAQWSGPPKSARASSGQASALVRRAP